MNYFKRLIKALYKEILEIPKGVVFLYAAIIGFIIMMPFFFIDELFIRPIYNFFKNV